MRSFDGRVRRLGLASCLLSALLMTLCGAAHAAPPLRVCMDPDNPPFSTDKADNPGLYVELAQRLAQAVGRPLQPVWTLSYWGKHSVRTTMLDRQCDAYIGLPEVKDFMGPNVKMSHPIVDLGFVIVAPKGKAVARLDDLDGMRVAVQFGSPAQSALVDHPGITSVTFIEAEQAMAALAAGKVDAAFLWGPTAGYINKTTLHDAYQILPVTGPGMQWQAAIGFPKDQDALRSQINDAIDAAKADIGALKDKYGFPPEQGATVSLAAAAAGPPPVQSATVIPVSQTTTTTTTPATPPPAATTASTDVEAGDTGKELFNTNCSHCHGPNAVQSERHIDLRRLHLKYGDHMDVIFEATVHSGRPDKGMPNWSGALSDAELNKILAWLHTQQSSS